MNLNLPASGRNGGIKIQEVSRIDNPKIVFKSDVPEEDLNALAAVFIEEIEKLLETEEGKAEFEKWMQEHSDGNDQKILSLAVSYFMVHQRLYTGSFVRYIIITRYQ